VDCYAGKAQLQNFAACADILVCLLPLTTETRGILNLDLFDAMPEGSGLINVGRGGHLVEDDLLTALSNGQLTSAVLDVLNDEPPDADHPFWEHPRIRLTPHIASMTGFDSAAKALIEDIQRYQSGERMVGAVDRDLGY
jgi:glyoxylate/hydroxypyruvate reductase A